MLTTKSVFGSCISLPSIPGLYSTCEEELLNLIKEVDMVVEEREVKLQMEVKETRSLCKSQKDKIDQIIDAVKQKEIECSTLRLQLQEERRKNLCQEEQFGNQIALLKEENSVLEEKNKALQCEVRDVSGNRLHVQNSDGDASKLQDKIAGLKDQLQKTEQKLLSLEENYQKLLTMNDSLQLELRNKENEGKRMDVPKCLDLNLMHEHISNVIRTYSEDEGEHMRTLQMKLSGEMDLLQENLKKTLAF